LPAWVRHLLLIIVVPALGIAANQVIKHNGIEGVDWSSTWRAMYNLAGFSAAVWFVGVFATGLTKQYGVGKGATAALVAPAQVTGANLVTVQPAPHVTPAPPPFT
jgi:hypothetical protein